MSNNRATEDIPPRFWTILLIGSAVGLAGVVLRSVSPWLGYGLIILAIVGTGMARRRYLQKPRK
jgi:hypothetical protein